MAHLSARGLLFILGCCLGGQLCNLAGQLVILSTCSLILVLLFWNYQIDEKGEGQRPNSPWGTGHKVGCLEESVLGKMSGTCQTPPSAKKRTGKLRKHRDSLQYHGDDEADRCKITSSPQSSGSAFPSLSGNPLNQRTIASRPSFTQQVERDVVLNWLKDVDKAEDEHRPLVRTPVALPAASIEPTLPLTAERLAGHLGGPQGGPRPAQVRIDASDCSSSSDPVAHPSSAQRSSSIIPIKRVIVPKGKGQGALALPSSVEHSVWSMATPTLHSRDSSDDSSPFSISSFNGNGPFASRSTSPSTSHQNEVVEVASTASRMGPRSAENASTESLLEDPEADSDSFKIDKLMQEVDELLQQEARMPKRHAQAASSTIKYSSAPRPNMAGSPSLHLESSSRSADEAVLPSMTRVYEGCAMSTDRLLDLVAKLNE
ncbi:uncharacterized protein SPSC_02787 [Sporisorium scitamineum]|uniref:Uncharacterized protein n=1 Tax=Sporisorium scitamineum TaxID=49012 RepID=A0A0F7SB34_9BASI|nr:uncharacterized protein SPSC_02787 [Sporisorium scitamineum]CDW99611.1 hypothetical protein [Sporisorium scitamineum]